MSIYWKYIRSLMEEGYKDPKNEFECIKNDKKNGYYEYPQCICISGICMNYVANELNLLKKDCIKGNLCWSKALNAYLFVGSEKKRMPNLIEEISEIEIPFENSSFCVDNDSPYVYLALRASEQIKGDAKKCKFIKYPFCTSHELKWYTFFVRDYRLFYEMKEYIDKLFRLFFFLYPNHGISLITEHKKQYGEDKEFVNYNTTIMKEFKSLICKLDRLNSDKKMKASDVVESVGEFVGNDLYALYSYFVTSNGQGDIRYIDEMLLEHANSVLALKGSRRLAVMDN